MSIEQKIAELLAESKAAAQAEQTQEEVIVEEEVVAEEAAAPVNAPQNPDNARNDVKDQDEAISKGKGKSSNVVNAKASAPEASHLKGVKEDIDALMNGEELSEEFRAKATTIYEAAIMSRVNVEVARIQEEFNAKLEEAIAQNQEGLVEKVDGYLDYIVEQWIAQNEIALERGMKSEILEGFVAGLKDLFEEHYVDIPEEKFDVLASMEDKVGELEAKLNEQVAANVEMNKTLGTIKRQQIVQEASAGLTDTEVEKFNSLAEELSYEDADTFKTKVQTIRENYFTNKTITEIQSVVTDTPVEVLTEEKAIDPNVKRYMAVLNNIK